MFRGLNWVMRALFLLSVMVQWYDPDPARWMAIYGAACAVCFMVARTGRIWWPAPVLIALVAFAWGLTSMAWGPAVNAYSHMFDTWQMKTPSVEEAREASGLLIVGVWMLVVAVAQRGARKS